MPNQKGVVGLPSDGKRAKSRPTPFRISILATNLFGQCVIASTQYEEPPIIKLVECARARRVAQLISDAIYRSLTINSRQFAEF
jgi:hypothetical protein